MREVDMSPQAVTARLRQLSELRRLVLILSKAKIVPRETQDRRQTKSRKQKTK
jgi:hypothetical protein